MTYRIKWLIEKKIILTTVNGEVTLEELEAQNGNILAHLQTGKANSLIHMIIDFRHVTKYPTNISEIHKYIGSRKEANMGWLLVVSDSRMIRFVSNVVTQLSKTSFRNFETVEEAIDFLKTQDTTIDWSLMTLNEE